MSKTHETPPEYLTRADGVRIAYRYMAGSGNNSAPVIVFLPGYMSDMQGGKAQAVADWAAENGRAMLRLDYSGCGESGGDFADGTLSLWRGDAMAVITKTCGNSPLLLIGSSMGGWLMLMLALALGARVSGMIGIAAAPDFTDWGYNDADRAVIQTEGVLLEANPYGPEPTPTYLGFWKDGDANKMLASDIAIHCPVRLLHGQCDDDVPWKVSVQLAEKLRSSDVQLHLIKDGDHRLSRDSDIDLLINTVSRMA
jgi:pimeloyl-ACP methyl ester carboxylesterase